MSRFQVTPNSHSPCRLSSSNVSLLDLYRAEGETRIFRDASEQRQGSPQQDELRAGRLRSRRLVQNRETRNCDIRLDRRPMDDDGPSFFLAQLPPRLEFEDQMVRSVDAAAAVRF